MTTCVWRLHDCTCMSGDYMYEWRLHDFTSRRGLHDCTCVWRLHDFTCVCGGYMTVHV